MTQWEQELLEAFAKRDARESKYQNVIDNYGRLAMRVTRLTERNHSLWMSNALIKGEEINKGLLISSSGFISTSLSSQKRRLWTILNDDGIEKIQKIKDEITKVHSVQNIYSIRQREMEISLYNSLDRCKNLQCEIDGTKFVKKDLENKIHNQNLIIIEKEKTIKNLQDEINNVYEKLESLDMIHMQLREENERMIRMWLDKAHDEAKRLNDNITTLIIS